MFRMFRRRDRFRLLALVAIAAAVSGSPTNARTPTYPITEPPPTPFQCSLMHSNYVSSRTLCNDYDNPLYREDCALACGFYTSWSTQCPLGDYTLDPFICGPQPIRVWETD